MQHRWIVLASRSSGALAVLGILLAVIVRAVVFAAPSPTDLVISEVMFNTCNITGNDETPWEWIEIKNKGTSNINITSSWQLCDSGGCINFPGSATIGPGEYWLLVESGTTAQDEINLTGSYDGSRTIDMGTGWRALGNDADTVYILDASLNLMDCISWGSTSKTCFNLGGGTDGAPANEAQGQSISKIGNDWQLSAQNGSPCPAYGYNCGGSPYGLNTWASGPTVVSLMNFESSANFSLLWPIGLSLFAVAVSSLGMLIYRRK